MKRLFLHVGWSKTGTSAVQAALHASRRQLLEKGILYPVSAQPRYDHSHHRLALALRSVWPHSEKLGAPEILQMIEKELAENDAKDLIISSELSPFYYDYPVFVDFMQKNFDRIVILFTVRLQSELLLSLFNQLIKDPNVRFSRSLFALTISQIEHLKFSTLISRWAEVVGKKNVYVFPYGPNIVQQFLEYFGVVGVQDEAKSQSQAVNPSLPTRALCQIQKCTRGIDQPDRYKRVIDRVVRSLSNHDKSFDNFVLFSADEQRTIDKYFENENKGVSGFPSLDSGFTLTKNYRDILAVSPAISIEFREY